MEVINEAQFQSFSMPQSAGVWAALGIFDGLHSGHRKVLSKCVFESRESGGIPVVFTFARHPAGVLGGEPVRKSISTIEERLEGFRQLGLKYTLLPEFTLDFARQAPDDFIRNILIEKLHISGVVVGFNYRFGRKRAGDVTYLQQQGERLGFKVHAIAPEQFKGKPISSTRIREQLKEGCIDDVEQMLGRPFTILGTVVGGDRRGRTIGFPTANLNLARPSFLPRGVYAARVWVGKGSVLQPEGSGIGAMLYIGGCPTFKNDQQDSSVEVHILDFKDDLYGQPLQVQPVERLRSEKRFDSMDALRKQILLDIDHAGLILSN